MGRSWGVPADACPECERRHTPEQGCLRGVVLVCGGRMYGRTLKHTTPERRRVAKAEREALVKALNSLDERMVIEAVRHGDAKGADVLSGKWARAMGIEEQACPADWNTHGRAAGPIRNAAMLEAGGVEVVMAFPGNKGTADMVRQARAFGGVRVWDRR